MTFWYQKCENIILFDPFQYQDLYTQGSVIFEFLYRVRENLMLFLFQWLCIPYILQVLQEILKIMYKINFHLHFSFESQLIIKIQIWLDPLQREPVDRRLRQREGRVPVLRLGLLGIDGHHQIRRSRLRRILLHCDHRQQVPIRWMNWEKKCGTKTRTGCVILPYLRHICI